MNSVPGDVLGDQGIHLVLTPQPLGPKPMTQRDIFSPVAIIGVDDLVTAPCQLGQSHRLAGTRHPSH